MTDFHIARKGTACDACGEPFEPGKPFVSAIFLAREEEGGFRRRDLHEGCAEGFDEEPYSRWVTRLPEKTRKKPPLDLALAREFLIRLVREADPERHKVALVLTLLLLRKRRVKVLSERIEGGVRVMDLRIPGTTGDIEATLAAPELDPGETEEITGELGRLFGLGEETEEDAPENSG